MTAPVRLLALGVLLAASPAMAEDVGLYAPLDLRPPAVATVRRPVIAMPPLPRLRPVHVASTRAMPPGVSPEIVGSIPVPHIVTSAKPVPIVAIAVEPAAPPMPPAPPPRALASLPPAAVPVQPPAAPAIDPAEPDELGSEPAMPFAAKPALPAVPPVKGEGPGTPPEIAAPPPVVAEPYELVRTLQSLRTVSHRARPMRFSGSGRSGPASMPSSRRPTPRSGRTSAMPPRRWSMCSAAVRRRSSNG